MAEEDITKIKVGQFAVSIIGMKQFMEEMSKTDADLPDDKVGSLMLERLGKSNYISNSAKEEYGKAFVREFRKFLGQPYTEESQQGLEIKVLGAGCNQCNDLSRMVMDVLTEMNLPAAFDHVTDIREIARYGIMGTPALLINGKTVAVGSVPPKDRLRKWLIEASRSLREQ